MEARCGRQPALEAGSLEHERHGWRSAATHGRGRASPEPGSSRCPTIDATRAQASNPHHRGLPLHNRPSSGHSAQLKLRLPCAGSSHPPAPWSRYRASAISSTRVRPPPHAPLSVPLLLPRTRLWACRAAMHPSNYAHWSLSTARDLTLEAARDASNARRTSTRMLPSGQLKKLLDSRSERDVLEGLRRVVTVGRRPPCLRPAPPTADRRRADVLPPAALADAPLLHPRN